MIRLLSFLLYLNVLLLGLDAEAQQVPEALTAEEVSRVDNFYKAYYEAIPKDIFFKDLLNFQLLHPGENNRIQKSKVDQIYDNHRLSGMANRLVSSFVKNEFYNKGYARLAYYLVSSFFIDRENLAANRMLIQTIDEMFFNEFAKRKEKEKKEKFLPHFVEGATGEWAWLTAGALVFVGSRGKGLKSLATPGVRASKWNKTLLNTPLVQTVYRPSTIAFDATKNFFNRPGWFRHFVKRFTKNVGALAGFAAFTGTTYGLGSWTAYATGVYDRANVKKQLDQDIFGLSALRLSCQARGFKNWANRVNLNSLNDEDIQRELLAKTIELNQMAEDYSVIADLAPLFLVTKAVSSDIDYRKGFVSFKNYKFPCPGLVKIGEDITVHLLQARQKISDAVLDIYEKLSDLKYGNSFRELDELYRYSDIGVLLDSGELKKFGNQFVVMDQNIHGMSTLIQNLRLYVRSPIIRADFWDAINLAFEEVLSSEDSRQEVLDWAKNTLMSLNDDNYYNYMLTYFKQRFSTQEDRAGLMLFTVALERQWKELKAEEEMIFLEKTKISPMTILGIFLGQMGIESPEKVEISDGWSDFEDGAYVMMPKQVEEAKLFNAAVEEGIQPEYNDHVGQYLKKLKEEKRIATQKLRNAAIEEGIQPEYNDHVGQYLKRLTKEERIAVQKMRNAAIEEGLRPEHDDTAGRYLKSLDKKKKRIRRGPRNLYPAMRGLMVKKNKNENSGKIVPREGQNSKEMPEEQESNSDYSQEDTGEPMEEQSSISQEEAALWKAP